MRSMFVLCLILTAALCGCTKPAAQSQARAPELKQFKVTGTPVSLPVEAGQVTKADPESVLNFGGDVTIPDHTKVRPGTRFTKVWKLENRFNAPVPAHVLNLSEEASFGPIEAPEAIWIPTVAPGKEVEIKAEMAIKADAPEGQCRAQYMGAPSSGMFLGPFCLVEVDKSAPPLPQSGTTNK